MSRAKISAVALVSALLLAACGGKDNPPPKAPEPEPVASATPEPPPPAAEPPATPEPAPAPAPPPTLALPSGSAKIDMKGKKAAKVELKSDGTVTSGGKMVAKISGMDVQGPDGKTMLSVAGDGAVTTGDGVSYGSFAGDDLTMSKGDKLSLGDDGALTLTSGAGKPAPLGKFDGASTSKRAAVLAAAVVMAPPAAPKAAATPASATGTGGGKGAGKGGGKKK